MSKTPSTHANKFRQNRSQVLSRPGHPDNGRVVLFTEYRQMNKQTNRQTDKQTNQQKWKHVCNLLLRRIGVINKNSKTLYFSIFPAASVNGFAPNLVPYRFVSRTYHQLCQFLFRDFEFCIGPKFAILHRLNLTLLIQWHTWPTCCVCHCDVHFDLGPIREFE